MFVSLFIYFKTDHLINYQIKGRKEEAGDRRMVVENEGKSMRREKQSERTMERRAEFEREKKSRMKRLPVDQIQNNNQSDVENGLIEGRKDSLADRT